MPKEHENQAYQHDHQKNHYIKKIISAAGDVRFGSKADIALQVRHVPNRDID